jgi:hypothetical protein
LDLFGFVWDEFAQRFNPGLQRGPVGSGLGCLPGPRYPYSGKLGVMEKAALADLLFVNGDPITDIALLEKPDTTLAMIMKGAGIQGRPEWIGGHAFSQSPPSRASRPFIGPILKGSSGSDMTHSPSHRRMAGICAKATAGVDVSGHYIRARGTRRLAESAPTRITSGGTGIRVKAATPL